MTSSNCLFCLPNSPKAKDFQLYKTEKKQLILTFGKVEQASLGHLLNKLHVSTLKKNNNLWSSMAFTQK